MKNKHIPQRTCVACRQIRNKKSLIRLVCAENGAVEIDTSTNRPGRGAYLCPKKGCWEVALRRNHLEYALRTKLSDDTRQALINYSNNLPEEVEFE
ncbi:MAG: YlxR family protein [Dehalococcoidia bacterium]|nr:YlxR family protein [Dehalococcoidia bacterium]